MSTSADFFAELPALSDPQATFAPHNFQPAPDDWGVVVTDIVNSTGLIADGNHKTVNFVAAMAISALKNLCAPRLIPFLFGGDGSVMMVPADQIDEARIILSRVRRKAADDFKVDLRISLATVRQLRSFGSDVQVARFEPSDGNNFGIFAGGGIEMLETAMRGRGYPELAQASVIDQNLDDGEPIDLEGLSCRWDELQSRRGKMVTLILSGDNAGEIESSYRHISHIAGSGGNPNPVRLDTLSLRWPPKGLLLEARARRASGPLAISVLKLLLETFIVRLMFASGRTIGGFNPERYTHEIVTNTDFCKFDQTLCFVLDCPEAAIEPIRNFLKSEAHQGKYRFGLHVSDTALMTCLVTSPTENLHVHFVDGGSGGYTEAAKVLKAS